ncbi:alpha/beta fold hydrolase [Streptomyces sp. enrichment culture]|uniref:alpha/beta fold hydrolase n=1 Tax=Streptomyces sp. enrichment culture TaxID=1795815 RepID=UPI003F55CD58
MPGRSRASSQAAAPPHSSKRPSRRSRYPASATARPSTCASGPTGSARVFAHDVPSTATRVLAAGQRPLSGTAFTDRCTAAAWRALPSWTLVCGQDRGIVPELRRFQARRAGSRTTEAASSHLPLYSRPDAVVSVIRAAARAA